MRIMKGLAKQTAEAISPSAVRGKDGFLFLGGEDHNSILSYLSAEKEIKYDAIRIHEANLKALDDLNLPYSMLVVPEAHIIYDDLLSDEIKVSCSRPARVLSSFFPGRFLYPERQFRDLRSAGVQVYSGNDSHWTEHAAFAGYQLARSAVGIDTSFIPPYPPSIDHEIGDLRIRSREEALRKFAISQKRPMPAAFQFLYDNNIVNHGRILFAKNDEAPQRRCILFGTSFSTSNLSCYMQDFSEVVFTYGTTVDPLLVKLIAPDFVFLEQPERFLHFPHLVLPGSSMLSHAMLAKSDSVFMAESSSGSERFHEAISYLNNLLTGSGKPDLLIGEPGHDEFISRVQYARAKQHDTQTTEVVRRVLTGSYRKDSVVAQMNFMISDGLFMDHPEVLPATELGLLAKVRIYIVLRRYQEAEDTLAQLCANHPASVESRYYEDYLRRLRG